MSTLLNDPSVPALPPPGAPDLAWVRAAVARADRLLYLSLRLAQRDDRMWEAITQARQELARVWDPLAGAEKEHEQVKHDEDRGPLNALRERLLPHVTQPKTLAHALASLVKLVNDLAEKAQQQKMEVKFTAHVYGIGMEVYERTLLTKHMPGVEVDDDH